MDIVVVANFCGKIDGTDNDRFQYIAEILCQTNQVELVTSNFHHGSKKHRQWEVQTTGYNVKQIQEPGYKKNVCLRRFYSHYVWGKNTYNYIRRREKPDIIYCAVPSLTAAYKIARYCSKNGIRFVIDIQDLWPEAFQMVFNVPILKNLIFAPFKFMANKIYKRANSICAVSQTYADRAMSVNKKCNKAMAVFLGTKLETFDRNVQTTDGIINKGDELWLGYCGTLGSSYDIKVVIDALSKVENPPKFIVMGDGPRKAEFEEYARQKKINSSFLGRLPYNQMCKTLSLCDIVVNPIVSKSVASIINKHADYAASGCPVLNTQSSDEYKKLVVKYHMGFNCDSGNSDDLALHLKTLLENKEIRESMGKNARRCAEECFDRETTYIEITKVIKGERK